MEEGKHARVILVVPKELVKTVKNALESHGKLEKTERIKPAISSRELCSQGPEHSNESQTGMFLVPTTAIMETAGRESTKIVEITSNEFLINLIGLPEHATRIRLLFHPVNLASSPISLTKPIRHPSLLAQIISQWLGSLPPSIFPLSVIDIMSQSPWSYTIYPPLLLLPTNTFSSPPWPSLLTKTLRPHLPVLYSLLCASMKVTHIALNGHIPSLLEHENLNILRYPNITPLHGDFTPPSPPSHPPTPSDLASAFWCTARQNGIFQTWAPLHTMFSRGNISEKTRLLSLPSLTTPGLGTSPARTSAVDLYAGIGYFALCYAKAGVGKVLCWELSAWSIEGLKRGAAENGWRTRTMPASTIAEATTTDPDGEEKFLIFHESNAHAAARIIASLRPHLPPIRHVNCGLLPSSRASWGTAIRALDPRLGGWVHVHENIPRMNVAVKREEVLGEFRNLVGEDAWTVSCVAAFEVKGYGPGVGHWVFDLEVLPPC